MGDKRGRCKGPEAGTPVESGTVREVTRGSPDTTATRSQGYSVGGGIRHQKQNRTEQSGTHNRTWCWPRSCRSPQELVQTWKIWTLLLTTSQTGSLLEPHPPLGLVLGPCLHLATPRGSWKALLSQLGENHPPPVSGADHHPYLINPLPTILITLVRLQQEPPPLDGCPSNFHPPTP